MAVDLQITPLGNKFQDYRQDILGDSFNFGPTINAGKVKYFAIHHSVTPQTAKNDGNWKAECDRIAQEHVNGNGWAGVGYRFIICSDGTVAYVADLSHGGAAVAGNNDILFSACLIGDFTKELPTAAQLHSAHILADWFINHMPQYPLISSWDNLIGHQDAAALLHLPGATPTACPGSNWRAAGDSLRDRIISDHFEGYPDPQPTVALPTPNPEPTPPSDCEKQVAGLKARNTDLTNQLATAQAEVKNREEQVGRLKDQVLSGEELRKDLNNKLTEALKGNASVVGVYEGKLKDKQRIIDEQGKQLGDKAKQIALLQADNQRLKANTVATLSVSDLFAALARKFAGK